MSKEMALYCSFCGKSQHEVRKLIAGPTVFICDECVDLCDFIVKEEPGRPYNPELRKWAWHEASIALSQGVPTVEEIVAMADAAIAYVSPARGPEPVSDSDGSGEAGETGTGSTEGDSAGPQDIAQSPLA